MREPLSSGVVFDIQRFCVHDGPGIRTTIFLKGCNMRCLWCHNPEGIPTDTHAGQSKTIDEIMNEVEKDTNYYLASGGGVTFSGGEPTLQLPFLFNLMTACRNLGLHTALETNGLFPSEHIPELVKHTDLFLYDIKHTDEVEHLKWTSVSNQRIVENLSAICKHNADVILRCPIIPGVNDNDNHFSELSKLRIRYGCIREIELMPYHNAGRDKWEKQGVPYMFHGLPTVTAEQKRLWQERLNFFVSANNV